MSPAATPAARLHRAAISTVNWVEVAQRPATQGVSPTELGELASESGLAIVPFDQPQAEAAAALRQPTRRLGLSYQRRQPD